MKAMLGNLPSSRRGVAYGSSTGIRCAVCWPCCAAELRWCSLFCFHKPNSPVVLYINVRKNTVPSNGVKNNGIPFYGNY